MDNLTHTLIGVATAHSLPKRFKKPSTYWALVIGNNLPDADFIQSLFTGSISLDYLVHHRGYTHSLFLTILLAGIGAWAAAKISRVRITREIYFFTLLGCWMHIGADFMNNYGIHPFSPFLNRWYYADSLFIVEPFIWFALLPMTFFLARGKWAKAFWGVIWAATTAIALVSSMISLPVRVAVLTVSVGSAMLHWKKLSSGRVALLWILMVGSVFNLASHSTKNRVRAELGSRLTGEEKIRDIDSMPAPGNPFCWHSWTVTEGQESFQFRSAAIAPFPMLVSPKACALSTRMAPVLAETVRTSAASQDPAVQWMYENTLSKKLLRETLKNSCTFKRLMTFLRFPFLKRINEDEWFAGDLRYDQRESNNFTAFRFKVGSKIENDCGPLNAPWEAPFFRTGSSLEEPEKSDRD